MTFLHAVATLWPKTKQIFNPANKGHFVLLMPGRYLILVFVSMFSLSARSQSPEHRGAVDGHQAVPFTKEAILEKINQNPRYDTKSFPLFYYKVDRNVIQGVAIGDSIPNELWDMPLWTVDAHGRQDTITLRDFDNEKLLILDFWTTWCQPCVASVIKWEKIVSENSDKVQLVNVHLDLDYKAKPFIESRSWVSPTIIGMGAYLLNAHFFTEDSFGKIVWIKSGKLYGISNAPQYSEEQLQAIVRDEVDHFESNTEAVYGF